MSHRAEKHRAFNPKTTILVILAMAITMLPGCGFGWLYMRVGDSHRIKGMKTLAYDKTQKRFASARKSYKRALEYYDDSVLYDEMGNPEVFFKAGETCLLLNPPRINDAETQFKWGLSVMRKKFDIENVTSADSIEITSSGIQFINVDNAVYSQLHAGMGLASFLRGIKEHEVGRFDIALEYLEIADETAKGYKGGDTGFVSKILDWFNLSEIVTPTPVAVLRAQVYLYRARWCLKKGGDREAKLYFDEAEASLLSVKNRFGDDSRLLAEYTRLHYLKKEYDKCNQYLDRILETKVYADKVNYTILRGNIFNETGDYDDAIRMFSEILELDPSNREALVGRSMSYARKGRTIEALGDLEDFLGQDTEDPQLYLHAGAVYSTVKQFTSAEQMLLKAFYIDPNDIEINFELGNLFRKLGKKTEMDGAYKKVIRISPLSSYAKEARKHLGK